jgi:hypothetical protein
LLAAYSSTLSLVKAIKAGVPDNEEIVRSIKPDYGLHPKYLKIDLNAHQNNCTEISEEKGTLEKELTDGRL